MNIFQSSPPKAPVLNFIYLFALFFPQKFKSQMSSSCNEKWDKQISPKPDQTKTTLYIAISRVQQLYR